MAACAEWAASQSVGVDVYFSARARECVFVELSWNYCRASASFTWDPSWYMPQYIYYRVPGSIPFRWCLSRSLAICIRFQRFVFFHNFVFWFYSVAVAYLASVACNFCMWAIKKIVIKWILVVHRLSHSTIVHDCSPSCSLAFTHFSIRFRFFSTFSRTFWFINLWLVHFLWVQNGNDVEYLWSKSGYSSRSPPAKIFQSDISHFQLEYNRLKCFISLI